ncbi:MAG: hypothetical protein ACRD3V_29640 [Vicinamibacteria bacterium]
MKNEEPRKSNGKGEPSPKKPYRRPEILYREKLEAMAALCVPAPPAKNNPGMCPQGPIAS